MLNIFYILYNDFRSNSAIHVHNLANAMSERGHECIVAVPDKKETAKQYIGGDILYQPAEYAEIRNSGLNFPNRKRPDIIHAWTPREKVRRECEYYKKLFPGTRVIVHLEDNEDLLLSSLTGLPLFFLKLLPDRILTKIIPEGNLSHPRYYKEFLSNSHGITVIIDKLAEVIKKDTPCHVLWPIIDTGEFNEKPDNKSLKRRLRIKSSAFVISYIGNIHKANAKEVKNLYVAVKEANLKGIPVTLVRTGKDHIGFFNKIGKNLRRYSIDLGFVERRMIPDILNISDLLVQPGKPGKFNDYRLPSKIPEFLSMGKPVAVPFTNIGKILKNNEQVIILNKGSAPEILDVILKIQTNPKLAKTISTGSRSFAIKHFSKKFIAEKLETFYTELI